MLQVRSSFKLRTRFRLDLKLVQLEAFQKLDHTHDQVELQLRSGQVIDNTLPTNAANATINTTHEQSRQNCPTTPSLPNVGGVGWGGVLSIKNTYLKCMNMQSAIMSATREMVYPLK